MIIKFQRYHIGPYAHGTNRLIITDNSFKVACRGPIWPGIHVGDSFYDGDLLFTVREIRMGTIVYMTDVLGEEELTLEQWGTAPAACCSCPLLPLA